MKALFVCSGGGHLKQLDTLSRRFGVRLEDQTWVTFRNGLSEGLLRDRRVEYVPFTGPRDGRNFARLLVQARRIIKAEEFDLAVSTGSSPALAFLPLAARRGAHACYVESAARAEGPSLTGRIIGRRFPSIQTFTQYPAWSDDRWSYGGSIYDEYAPGDARSAPQEIRKVVVSTGTQEGYRFDRLFERLAPMLAGREVLWQTTDTDTDNRFGIRARRHVPHDEMQQAVREADVVIAHSGTGATLTALEAGKSPILVPRLQQYGEHIDDHQLQIAGEMSRRGLALQRDAHELCWSDLVLASRMTVTRQEPPAFDLMPRGRRQLQSV